MIRNEIGRASPRGVTAIAAAPLADVGCCHNIPEVQGSIEPSAEPQLRVSQVLDGRFLIREPIRRGGTATIYRAEDMLYGRRDVAIKVPLLSVESDPISFARFRHEEEVGRKLSHPFLLKICPVADEKCRPYIVMEFLRGCTLAHLNHETRPLAETDALKIVGLVCDAVGAMHEQGIIHRRS